LYFEKYSFIFSGMSLWEGGILEMGVVCVKGKDMQFGKESIGLRKGGGG